MAKDSNQKADVHNPNNPAYKAAQDNRANQLNPQHEPTKNDTQSQCTGQSGSNNQPLKESK